MIAVIFEVEMNPERQARYFDLAASLRPELDAVDGFISVERFESLSTPNKFLSLSIWRDEAAVEAWYRHEGHRFAQREGRGGVFDDFRIRVAHIVRDYTLAESRPHTSTE